MVMQNASPRGVPYSKMHHGGFPYSKTLHLGESPMCPLGGFMPERPTITCRLIDDTSEV